MSAGFGEVPKVEIDGVTYEQKMDVTSLLMIGIDKASTDEIKGYRDGGQSDFLLLLVLDHKNKTIRQLQIDRDTMTSVNVLGLVWQQRGFARHADLSFPRLRHGSPGTMPKFAQGG